MFIPVWALVLIVFFSFLFLDKAYRSGFADGSKATQAKVLSLFADLAKDDKNNKED